MKKKQFIEILLFLVTILSYTLERPVFTIIGTRDGLPNSAVSAIVQDSKGFIWFGTQAGLVRYDGYSFKLYENEPFEENVLSHNQVQTLFLDGDILWIGTYGGLNRLDLKTNRLSSYVKDTARPESIQDNLVVSIARDVQGKLWVGTAQGLDQFDEQSGRFIHYGPKDDGTGIPRIMIRDLHLDRKGRLWVATSGKGLYLYQDTTDNFNHIKDDKNNPDALPSPYVMSISEDPEGQLWFATWYGGISVLTDPAAFRFKTIRFEDERLYFVNAQDQDLVYAGTWGGGLFVYSKSSGAIECIKSSYGTGSIPNDVVYSSLIDSQRILWIGTNGGGIARSESKKRRYRAYTANPENPGSLAPGKVTSILEDQQGLLWVGIYGSGLQVLDRTTDVLKQYRHHKNKQGSLPNDIVNTIYEDSRGVIWLATNEGLARYNRSTDSFITYLPDPANPDSISDSVIYALKEAPGYKLWIGTYTHGLELMDIERETFTHFPANSEDDRYPQDSLVYALEYDGVGNLWIGYNNGLDRYEQGRFIRYRYNRTNKTGISSNTIRHIYRDSLGTLWLGTVGGGLSRYVADKDQFIHLTKKEGIPHNTVRSIIEDDEGNLWVGTAIGIGYIDKQGLEFRGFSLFNDLKDREFHTGVCKTRDGRIFFGGQSALYEIDPRSAEKVKPPPELVISDITINSKSLWDDFSFSTPPYITSLELPYDKNNVSFFFSANDLQEPNRNLFSYKLEGFDKSWSIPSTDHVAYYTNLPGGTYLLKVRVANSEGVWNDDALNFPIKVASPPWLSFWAFLFYGCIILTIGYTIALMRSRKKLEEANRRLDTLTMKDGLTGISNRRHLDELLPRIVAEASRDKSPLSVFMLDIDCFKNYNDHYGHLKGDEVLKTVAALLADRAGRATDLVARYGGEEFIVLLPHTDKAGAEIMAKEILQNIRDLQIPHETSFVLPVLTISIGMVTLIPEPGQDPASIVEKADKALYQAKAEGRNCYRIFI
ncbi:ligand-binding sensor domain-containing diguanylate cyclase [Gracilinema caldarium]|uniref:diguanylate cyclase n=1 Tax=Gracilinema caldarium (strain ATCC 51460 / DSM 7334 / H1) TaxID=744872 RepID=F8F3S9_GRAC1|nr:ligand-binding sensor domain-containing diguanylate cyclase [Gracilinema caldarium]AEJ20448.1 diguanylate cyclase with beta propeller sensor [Gracilinema caldarium DSM 7334]